MNLPTGESGDNGSSSWMYEAPMVAPGPGDAAGSLCVATRSMASRTPCSWLTSRDVTVSPNTEQYRDTASSRSRQAIPTWSILFSMIRL